MAPVAGLTPEELTELRARLYSPSDVGAFLMGSPPPLKTDRIPSRLKVNPYIVAEPGTDSLILYAYRLDCGARIHRSDSALVDEFRTPFILDDYGSEEQELAKTLFSNGILVPGNFNVKHISWRGPRVMQHTLDQGQNAAIPLATAPPLLHYLLLSRRVGVIYMYDQGPATPFSIANRAHIIDEALEEDARILLVGDDDFLSLALALKGKKHIVVVDIDERIIDTINELAAEHDFSIQTVKLDIRQPITPEFQGSFDAVVTDPVYASAEAEVFCKFARDALNPESESRFFFLSYASWINDYPQLCKIVGSYGFTLAEKFSYMNEYYFGTELGQTGIFEEMFASQVPTRASQSVPPAIFYSDFHMYEL